jgi:hypothetical protein
MNITKNHSNNLGLEINLQEIKNRFMYYIQSTELSTKICQTKSVTYMRISVIHTDHIHNEIRSRINSTNAYYLVLYISQFHLLHENINSKKF